MGSGLVGFYTKGRLPRGVVCFLREKASLARTKAGTKASNARASGIQKIRKYCRFSKQLRSLRSVTKDPALTGVRDGFRVDVMSTAKATD